MKIDVGNEHKPLWWQAQVLKKALKTNRLSFLGARQTGKTWLGRTIIKDFLFTYDKRPNPTIIVVTPFLYQCVDLYYKNIMKEIGHLEGIILFKQGSVSSGRITLTLKRPWFKDVAVVEFFGANNPQALRGRTGDCVIVDEFAFMNGDVYFEIIQYFVRFTKGKIFLTSTVNGYNHFFDVVEDHKEHDDHTGAHIEFNAITCQKDTLQEVMTEWSVARRQGKETKFLQENMHCWEAAEIGEAPFASLINSVQKRNKHILDDKQLKLSGNIFAVFDRGKPGNNACWVGILNRGNIELYEYFDHLSNYDAVEYLVHKYRNFNIRMVYPNDIVVPSTNDGKPEIDTLNEYLRKKGYDRIVTVSQLEKVKDKKSLVEKTERALREIRFHLKGTKDGRRKLTNVRHPKSTQGVIDYKKFALNDFQHTGDALCHLVEAHEYGYTHTKLRKQDIVDQPATHTGPKWTNTANNFVKHKRRN